jgi:hypothetical protein
VALVDSARKRLEGRVDVAPGDLLIILESILRPFGSGKRFFLREIAPGVHVP